jgi:hypothetical protein
MSPRLGGVAGLIYVAAVVVGSLVAGGPDEGPASDATLLAYYSDSGNQWRAFAGALVIGVAAIAFLWYLLVLCERLAPAGAPWPPLVRLAFASGVAFLVVDEIGAAIGAAIPAAAIYSSELSDVHDAESTRVLLILGHHWLAGLAGVLAAPLVAAASLQARARGLMPRWLVWVGLVLAVLLLLSQLAFTGIPIGLWIIATALWLLLGRDKVAT